MARKNVESWTVNGRKSGRLKTPHNDSITRGKWSITETYWLKKTFEHGSAVPKLHVPGLGSLNERNVINNNSRPPIVRWRGSTDL